MILVARGAMMFLSSYGVRHQGYIEAIYHDAALLSPTDPARLKDAFRYWPIHISFTLFGASEATARLPGLVAMTLSAILTVPIAYRFGGPTAARFTPLVFLSTPWVLTWMPRAMPDAWLVLGILLFTAGVCLLHRSWTFGALLPLGFWVAIESKPIGILTLLGLALIRSRGDAVKTVLWLIPTMLLAWLAQPGLPGYITYRIWVQGQVHGVFVNPWEPIVSGAILGLGPLLWLVVNGFLQSGGPRLYLAAAVWGWYSAWGSIRNHAYYALPMSVFLALAASLGSKATRPGTLRLVLAIMLPWNLAVLTLSGDIGDERSLVLLSFGEGEHVTGTTGEYTAIVAHYRPDLVPDPTAKAGFGPDPPSNQCSILDERRYLGAPLYAWRCPNQATGSGATVP